MSLAVLGLAAEGASRIDEPEVVAISYPDFFATLESWEADENAAFHGGIPAFQPKKADLRAVLAGRSAIR